jgi:hypothetical protein
MGSAGDLSARRGPGVMRNGSMGDPTRLEASVDPLRPDDSLLRSLRAPFHVLLWSRSARPALARPLSRFLAPLMITHTKEKTPQQLSPKPT